MSPLFFYKTAWLRILSGVNMDIDKEYIHYQESITSLTRAWRTACELENTPPGSAIWSAAYRMVLIEYCKPFKYSFDEVKKRYKLPAPRFDEEKKILHEKIENLRDQVLAHCDISVLEAKVYYNPEAKFPVPLICQNNLTGLPNITEIRELIEYVLDEIYPEQERYNQRYADSH
ncbi:hypothetical protein [Nitrosomonas marina]|uniref:HEPN domain-containing protein n=1 Tax=Nitrosomonas marina TaxID=917 RepID=A0A1H8I655_9PROT|nr:hypothetical protein [Nitrosomonas marina]SEN63784.1 hypothetical protein SAMN05216325_12919 [Nitrosomonas marina]